MPGPSKTVVVVTTCLYSEVLNAAIAGRPSILCPRSRIARGCLAGQGQTMGSEAKERTGSDFTKERRRRRREGGGGAFEVRPLLPISRSL